MTFKMLKMNRGYIYINIPSYLLDDNTIVLLMNHITLSWIKILQSYDIQYSRK